MHTAAGGAALDSPRWPWVIIIVIITQREKTSVILTVHVIALEGKPLWLFHLHRKGLFQWNRPKVGHVKYHASICREADTYPPLTIPGLVGQSSSKVTIVREL